MSSRRQRSLPIVVAAIAVAVILYLVLRPGGPTVPQTPEQELNSLQSGAQPPTRVIQTRDDRPVGGIARITVRRGQTVRFEVRSNTRQEVHVHGYDLARTAAPGHPARFAFKADVAGIFAGELEAPGVQILQLTVQA